MAQKILRPVTTTGVIEDLWAIYVGSSKPASVDPGEPISHDENTSYNERAASAIKQYFFPFQGWSESMASVTSVTVYVRAREVVPGAQIIIRVSDNGAAEGVSSSINLEADYADYSEVFTTKPSGGSWTEATVRSLQFGYSNVNSNWTRVTSAWAVVDYVPGLVGTLFPRDIASRILRWTRFPSGEVKLVVDVVDGLDLRPMDKFFLSWPHGPHEDGAGWGKKIWQRRLFEVTSIDFDPMTLTCQVVGRDWRRYGCPSRRTDHYI